MALYYIFLYLLGFSLYQVGASSANSNPGAGELTGRISGRLYPENLVVTQHCLWTLITLKKVERFYRTELSYQLIDLVTDNPFVGTVLDAFLWR